MAARVMKITWHSDTVIPANSIITALIYKEVGEEIEIIHAFPRGMDLDGIYLKALLATHKVDQGNTVKILYLGSPAGELKGQC